MTDKQKRRAAGIAYKEQPDTGGIYRFVNTRTGWRGPLKATPNLQGEKNKFDFSKRHNACFDFDLRAQWQAHGTQAFAFEQIEELPAKPGQSAQEFREDLQALLQLWCEREDEQAACEASPPDDRG